MSVEGSRIGHERIERVFDRMRNFWDQALYVRALGYHLAALAAANDVLGPVERRLRVEYQDPQGGGSVFNAAATA